MGLNRYAKRKDKTQEAIVKALRKAGVKVWILDTPCDLLTYWAGLWMPLEVKSDEKSRLTDEQKRMERECGLKIVTTPEEALRAVGLI